VGIVRFNGMTEFPRKNGKTCVIWISAVCLTLVTRAQKSPATKKHSEGNWQDNNLQAAAE
jgi:hypothetical protein